MRDGFVERVERPTYDELAQEFNAPLARIQRISAEEGWPTMRAARLEEKMRAADAGAAILRAVKVDDHLVRGLGEVAMEIIAKLRTSVDSIETKKSVTTRINTLNTASFAYLNLCNGLARLGIVGLPKSLKDAACNPANGQWNQSLLKSINVTVQNIVATQRPPEVPEPVQEIPAEPAQLEQGAEVVLPAVQEPVAVPADAHQQVAELCPVTPPA